MNWKTKSNRPGKSKMIGQPFSHFSFAFFPLMHPFWK